MLSMHLYKESNSIPIVDVFYPFERDKYQVTQYNNDWHRCVIIDHQLIYRTIPSLEECDIQRTTKEDAQIWCYAHEVTLLNYKKVLALWRYLQKIWKILLIIQYGDYEFMLPFTKNTLVVRRSYKKSLATSNDIIAPVWVQPKWRKDAVKNSTWQRIPTVAYLWYSRWSYLHAVISRLIRRIFNTKLWHTIYHFIAHYTQSTLLVWGIILPQLGVWKSVRGKMIDAFTNADVLLKKILVIRNNVIVHQIDQKHHIEYQDALSSSQYWLCSRGLGNFSIRFYELLAAWVIPVLCDTDTILPFESKINYDKYIITIDENQLHTLQDKILIHRHTHQHIFSQLEDEIIALWQTYFTYTNGIKVLYKEIEERTVRFV